ncbi:hypothetical protein K474DRAFT_1586594 [Panus rudis PR-1116 ss-1]|nr:hypothetical protein K474DRAFT_1586594 [Panus rudis PR-1116 ss-1]
MKQDDASEFSSNRCTVSTLAEYQVPVRHPDLSFDDGNLAVLAGHNYFLVHKGVLCHHSPSLKQAIDELTNDSACPVLEGRPVLSIPYPPQDVSCFLRVLYGLPVSLDGNDFQITYALLTLSTRYDITTLRAEVLRRLGMSWPRTLAQWEAREKKATNADGVYVPRPSLPHPNVIIALAEVINAPELLPSAFYDLSRYLPSQLVAPYTDPSTSAIYVLSAANVYKVLKGKEQSARYFSTFIVNELEGRMPAKWCIYRNEAQPSRKRNCQVAFETITLGILRDSNGLVLNLNSDPLFAIADSLLMQTRDDSPGTDNKSAFRACEACRLEFGSVVQAAREEFWSKIPEWFDLTVENWT